MKKSLVWFIGFATMLVLFGVAFFNFMATYDNEASSFRELIFSATIVLVLSSTIVGALQVFIIWLFADQVAKLKEYTEDVTSELDGIRKEQEKTRESIELIV